MEDRRDIAKGPTAFSSLQNPNSPEHNAEEARGRGNSLRGLVESDMASVLEEA